MSAAGRHARPGRGRAARRRRWYGLPLPLAALFAVVMPWVAVRDVRRSHTAFRQLCDIMIAAHERGLLGQADADSAPKPRHLRIIQGGRQ